MHLTLLQWAVIHTSDHCSHHGHVTTHPSSGPSWHLLGLVFLWQTLEVWHGPKRYSPQKCKQLSCIFLLEEVLSTTTQYAHCLPLQWWSWKQMQMSFHQPGGWVTMLGGDSLLDHSRYTHTSEKETCWGKLLCFGVVCYHI